MSQASAVAYGAVCMARPGGNLAAAGNPAACTAGPTVQHRARSAVLFCGTLGFGALPAAPDNAVAILLTPCRCPLHPSLSLHV